MFKLNVLRQSSSPGRTSKRRRGTQLVILVNKDENVNLNVWPIKLDQNKRVFARYVGGHRGVRYYFIADNALILGVMHRNTKQKSCVM